ncbi:unnamed protein product [Danaus chrysippus]|uniref:(African queen) hypothetical protein n=1 Tax=Danaus chrysippus TaxID=151541 RepID=A0A8J2VRC0_9NEOP|nr:unnamed protein product [Danaus chrysippus]
MLTGTVQRSAFQSTRASLSVSLTIYRAFRNRNNSTVFVLFVVACVSDCGFGCKPLSWQRSSDSRYGALSPQDRRGPKHEQVQGTGKIAHAA